MSSQNEEEEVIEVCVTEEDNISSGDPQQRGVFRDPAHAEKVKQKQLTVVQKKTTEVPRMADTQSLKHLKLTFPSLNEGGDAMEWLRDCEEYFSIFEVTNQRRSAIAAMHMSGTPRGQLLSKIPGLTPEYFLENFIGGLQAEIRSMIRLLEPRTLEQALKVARSYEQSQTSQPKKGNSYRTSYSYQASYKYVAEPSSNNNNNKSTLIVPAKGAEFVRGHECKKPQNFLMIAEEETTNDYEGAPIFDEDPNEEEYDLQEKKLILAALGVHEQKMRFNWKGKEILLSPEANIEIIKTCFNISEVVPRWMEQIKGSYEGDAEMQELIAILTVDKSGPQKYYLRQGLLMQCIGRWIRECSVCQQAKGQHVKSPGLLQPLKISQEPWRDIAMNFITGLPKSKGKEVVYGSKPRHLAWQDRGDSNIYSLETLLAERQLQWARLRELLEVAQAKLKSYADTRRSERQFQKGDWVYLKLQPYKQVYVVIRRNLKLAAKFYGPYEIVEKVGSVAYKLAMPVTSRIHPIFHVSQLKKTIGQSKVQQQLPHVNDHGTFDLTPSRQLDSRHVLRDHKVVYQKLVQWRGCSVGEATREDEELLKCSFLEFLPP
ncbi:hypothetical protein AgCh_010225 [Apium graveolens]